MTLTLKIRGIYATALTAFFLEKGIAIASPSEETARRFIKAKGTVFCESADGEISDLEGGQGILIQGEWSACARTIELIKKSFIDAIFRKSRTPWAAEIEFPGSAKSVLDEYRKGIAPTVLNHHRLKIIASELVDLTEERELANNPQEMRAVSENLEKTLIWDGYAEGKEIAIEHVKPDGQIVYLSEGSVIDANFKEKRLILRRSKFKGRSRYDGLDIEKREGDYAITEAKEGDWFYRHTYMRRDGKPIGWYFNVNTPIEFYPNKIRYVDLEIDVVAWPFGSVEVKDEHILEDQLRAGFLSENLKGKAMQVAYDLRSSFLRKGDA